MSKEELQVENGNYTRIVNPLIEELIKIPFKGCELAVAIFIIRKTYGFQKTQDEISLSQFQEGLNRSRQTIVTALKNLVLVNVARLVKQGSAKGDCNIWSINKYYDSWKLVNTARLVKRKRGASLTEAQNLVKTARHTKEITKDNTKEIAETSSADVVRVIDSFKEVNPTYKKWYGNTTQRKACEGLIKSHGLEKVLRVVAILPKTNKATYLPTVTTPLQLEDKWAALEAGLIKKKSEFDQKDWRNNVIV